MVTKIIKFGWAKPDASETQVAQSLLVLKINSNLKAQLRELHITKTREMQLNKKRIIIYTSMPKLKQFQKFKLY
ncbi:unnamed protein product [Diabrotica balteata]|uniref:Small ribosomal subunit protein eS7 n=1 Tax=Diabrotica balteata TaxID=107213 RepID=A0A9N9SQ41_DIABA|nr:unnamed protein product [Diabrotica balteata]